MQPQSLNLTRPKHFGLVRCDDGQAALHMHYGADQLDTSSIGMFYQDLGTYHLQPGRVPMEARIDLGKQVITVVPLRPTNDYLPLEEVGSHLGCIGPLHFINADDCTLIAGPSMPQ